MMRVKYWLYGPELHDAIDSAKRGNKNAYKKAEKICINEPRWLKFYRIGATPLHEAMILRRDDFVVLYLKHGADPNDAVNCETWQGKPIQRYVNNRNLSMIGLLAVHGANIENVIFPSENDDTFTAYKAGNALFVKKQVFIKWIEDWQPPLTEETQHVITEQCTRIQQAFLALADQESNETFKNYYLEEADRYTYLPNEIFQQMTKQAKALSNQSSMEFFKPRLSWRSNVEELKRQTTPLLLGKEPAVSSLPLKKGY